MSGSSFLWMGLTWTFFRSSGNRPASAQVEMVLIGPDRTCEPALMSFAGGRSTPVAFLGFSFLIALVTKYWSTGLKLIDLCPLRHFP